MNPTCPQDIIDEVNAIAVSETDRIALLNMVSGFRAQVARAIVAISKGSHAYLHEVLDAYPCLWEDDRDLLTYANENVDYEARYFIEPFPIIKARPKIYPKPEQEFLLPFKYPMEEGYDFCTDVELHWEKIIMQFNLSVERVTLKEIELKNQHVKLVVRIGHRYPLECDFCRPESKTWEKFELLAYVRALWERRRRILPNWLSKVPEEDRITACLEKYGELILQYFSRPATGDFDWKDAYQKDDEDRMHCRGKLMVMESNEDARTPPILEKYEKGDPTWRDDMRKILAEFEAWRRGVQSSGRASKKRSFWQLVKGLLFSSKE